MDLGAYFSVRGVFTPDECDLIVETYSKKHLQKGATVKDSSVARKSKIIFIESNQENEWIYRRLFEFAFEFNKEKYKFNMEGSFFQPIQFTKYEEGDYYGWHVDNGPSPQTCIRKLSISVQLSDPDTYQGGQLQIGNSDEYLEIPLQDKGSATIFPSFLRHQVTKVTKGTRCSLVVWAAGVPFT